MVPHLSRNISREMVREMNLRKRNNVPISRGGPLLPFQSMGEDFYTYLRKFVSRGREVCKGTAGTADGVNVRTLVGPRVTNG